MAALNAQPLVGVGMPVYNGERFLAEAIESVLGQTESAIELVISDNASADGTAAICRRYAAADARVRYHRNDANIGALPNFNRVFELARGRYFKWAAHDDVLQPDFLRRCIDALEAAPDAALCQSAIEYIDESGSTLGIHAHHVPGSDSDDSAQRFAALILRPHDCYDMMGVLRRDLVERSMPLESYHGSDRALLARIALAGRYISIPEPLQKVRDHAGRYSRSQKKLRDREVSFDPRNAGRPSFPVWRMYGSYWRSIVSPAVPADAKSRARLALLKWWFVNFNAIRMAVDVVGRFAPGVVDAAERVKQSVFSPAPGPGDVRRSRKR